MKKCKYDKNYMENFKPLMDFVTLLENAEKMYKQLYDRVGELDKETSDMLHDLEFDKFYRTEGHRKARHMQAIRQERRAAKNTIELLAPLRDFARNNRNLRSSVKRVLNEIEKAANAQETRVYIPRVLDTITINNRHFECNVIQLEEKKTK